MGMRVRGMRVRGGGGDGAGGEIDYNHIVLTDY